MRTVKMSILGLIAIASTVTIARADNGIHQGGGPGLNLTVQSNQVTLYRSIGECNDAWSSGITLRESGVGGVTGGTITVPPQVAGNIAYAQIFWVILDGTRNPGAVAVNGNAVVPVDNGPVTASPCWGIPNAYSYRADVSAFIVSGVNSLTGFPDSGNRAVAPSTEGVSLVIVYRTNTADKEIIVLGGNDLLQGPFGADRIDLSIPATAGFGAELTMIVGDGQVAIDAVDWNGVVVSSPDAFQGLDPGPGVGYWDTQEYGVATGGTNTVSLYTPTLPGAPDCLNWVATVLGVKRGGCIVPVEPTTWSNIKRLVD